MTWLLLTLALLGLQFASVTVGRRVASDEARRLGLGLSLAVCGANVVLQTVHLLGGGL